MLNLLVDYSDNSDEETVADCLPARASRSSTPSTKRKAVTSVDDSATAKKARTLPILDSSLFSPAPVDDPSKHQGRTRSVPYVEGQFIGHVYIPIRLEGELLSLLREVVQCVQATNSAWHSFLDPVEDGQMSSKVIKHLSLSRPIALRAHQRDDLKREIKRAAGRASRFSVSFSRFTTLNNDEKTRVFLCAEVGAGHKQLQDLAESLNPHLSSLRQMPYYPQPRFHVSIAWILISPPVLVSGSVEPSVSESASNPGANRADRFIEDVSVSIEQLRNTHTERLLALGRLEVRNLEVKIGKDTHQWPLGT